MIQKASDLLVKNQGKFEKFHAVFSDWNQKMNLSGISGKKEIWEKHFLDSLIGAEIVDFSQKKVLDIGCGGGFPLLPIAIAFPSAKCHGIDSVRKKLRAVQSMADQMQLLVITEWGRLEMLGHHKNFREKFDIVTARAVAPWNVLLEYALPFVRIGGFFLAYQGPAIKNELQGSQNIVKKLGGKISKIEHKKIGDADRILVLIEKIALAPKAFPRAQGIPRKNPLSI